MDTSIEVLSAEEVFSTWASENGPWSNWVKPALFASMDNQLNNVETSASVELPEASWYSSELQKSALILDLPSSQSILEGLALLKYHYQPVPLFNCCRAPGMIVDVNPIVEGLWKGSKNLKQRAITQNALPAFLLDSNRFANDSLRAPGKFDNRWCVVPQDMPSSTMLKSFGLKSVCIRTNMVEIDISHILKRYQVDGIKVLVQIATSQKIEEFSMPMSNLFRSIWYRIEVLAGLKRNAAGGFGAVIPMPASSGTAGGFHGGFG